MTTPDKPLPSALSEKSVEERLNDIQMRVHAIRGNTSALIRDVEALREQLREEGVRVGDSDKRG